MAAALALLIAALAACSAQPLTPDPSPLPEGSIAVAIEDARFVAEVVDTPETRAQGLSDRAELGMDQGMWFDFGSELMPSFWMRNMQFPIDMVWISEELEVVAVTHAAPAPEPGTPDTELPRYTSGGIPVRYVLEINAGLAEEAGIGPGSVVTVTGS